MSSIHSNNLPNFIKAKSAKGLRRLMFKVNSKRSAEIKYFDIQFVNGFWYAWFYEPLETIEQLENL